MKESDYMKGLAKYLVKRDEHLALNMTQAKQLVGYIRSFEAAAGMLPPGIYVPRGPFETVEYVWEPEEKLWQF